MIIDCKQDPNDLIDMIGDRFFSCVEEGLDPHKTVIQCCEDVIRIEISVDEEFGDLEESTQALLKLLNQEYRVISK